MRQLLLLDSALADLLAIQMFVTRESGSLAVGESLVEKIGQQCRKLAGLPGTLGRARPELRPDIRSFPFKGYVIFFRYEANRFEVVNILESHRDMIEFFNRE